MTTLPYTKESHERLKKFVREGGICWPDPENCTLCPLRESPTLRGHTPCNIPSAVTTEVAWARIKDKAIQKLLEHGYTLDVIEILL